MVLQMASYAYQIDDQNAFLSSKDFTYGFINTKMDSTFVYTHHANKIPFKYKELAPNIIFLSTKGGMSTIDGTDGVEGVYNGYTILFQNIRIFQKENLNSESVSRMYPQITGLDDQFLFVMYNDLKNRIQDGTLNESLYLAFLKVEKEEDDWIIMADNFALSIYGGAMHDLIIDRHMQENIINKLVALIKHPEMLPNKYKEDLAENSKDPGKLKASIIDNLPEYFDNRKTDITTAVIIDEWIYKASSFSFKVLGTALSFTPNPGFKLIGIAMLESSFVQDFICANEVMDDTYLYNRELEQEKSSIYELIGAN